MTHFDWAALMKAGLNRLGLRPCEFWALTPVELGMMLGIEAGAMPLDRERLNEMIHNFPDLGRKKDG